MPKRQYLEASDAGLPRSTGARLWRSSFLVVVTRCAHTRRRGPRTRTGRAPSPRGCGVRWRRARSSRARASCRPDERRVPRRGLPRATGARAPSHGLRRGVPYSPRAHLTGGLAPGSRSSVPEDWHAETGGRIAVTTPSGATRTHRFASDAELRTPKVIRSVVAPAPRSPSSPASAPPNPNPNAPPPFPPRDAAVSFSEHAGDAEHAQPSTSRTTKSASTRTTRLSRRDAPPSVTRATCGAADAFFGRGRAVRARARA